MKAAGTKGIPARIGGDEFMMVLEDIKDELELRNILRVVRSGFQWLYPDKLKGIHFGCSIGVAMYPQDARDYDTLVNIADNALYLAKAKGKNRYIIYDIYKHGELSGDNLSLALVQKEKIRHVTVSGFDHFSFLRNPPNIITVEPLFDIWADETIRLLSSVPQPLYRVRFLPVQLQVPENRDQNSCVCL